MKKINGLTDEVIIKSKNIFNDNVKIGEDKKLTIDTEFDPVRHLRMWGEVVQVPTRMSNDRAILALADSNTQKPPSHNWASEITLRYYSDLPTPAEPGDKAWFHWNALANADNALQEHHYKIDYELLICVQKYYEVMPDGRIYKINPFTDEKLYEVKEDLFTDDDAYFNQNDRDFCRRTVMCNGYVLCHPDKESWDDVLRPLPELDLKGNPIKDNSGRIVLKPESKWLRLKKEPTNRYSLAIVDTVGEKVNNDPNLDIKKGDHIFYYHNANWKVIIDDVMYFVIRQKFILGIINSKLSEIKKA